MSKGRKSEYPYRPARKGKPKSSSNGGGRRKTWTSLRDKVEGGRDVSPRLNASWWHSPLMKAARLAKWATKEEAKMIKLL